VIYRVARSLLFRLPPETAHRLGLAGLDLAHRLGAGYRTPPQPHPPVEVMGLRFPNRIGLAAGMDKDGRHLDSLGGLGVGFIEVGTVTPRPQPGNPPPRLFRLPHNDALINRMGFNNDGVDALVKRLQQRCYTGILGINIGKNKDTPADAALDDYRTALTAVYPHADYIAINISSPNTPGLRDLQQEDALQALLDAVCATRAELMTKHDRRVPLALKLAPDLTPAELQACASVIAASDIDAVIATNTTLARDGLQSDRAATEAGGLSGRPLRDRSTEILRHLRALLPPRIALIGVGGIFSLADAQAKRDAGADLVQLYTGLIYQGPRLIRQLSALR
jgi:dihydroorotate dehydrogenase